LVTKRSGYARDTVSITLGINSPQRLIPLDRESEDLPLPRQTSHAGPTITYGRYLRTVAAYLSKSNYRAVRELLVRSDLSYPPLNSADSIELVSEKHGALYSVARLKIHFPSQIRSFAVNTAFSHEQQAFLQVECRLLRDLYRRYCLSHLPRALLFGSALLQTAGASFPVKLFVSDWFEDFHEFHLSRMFPENGQLGIRVWTRGENGPFLDAKQTGELYEQATGILTDYLDTESFRQIYPWHHAAGDFVVNLTGDLIRVRLITARSFRRILPRGSDISDKVLGSLHFFLNTGIRMRLDRLDGTGTLAWADSACLPWIIRGFISSWNKKKRETPDLEDARDLFALFLQFSQDEKLGFAEIAAANGQVEAGEADFLGPLLPAHVSDLSAALEEFL
jgi:hypothetical protein